MKARLHVALAVALVLCSLAALGPPARAERPQAGAKDSEKVVAIRKLMVLTGSGQLGMQVMTQLIGSLKSAMPNVPERFWQDFAKEVNPDELIEMVIPVYDRHLTLAEVREVIRFYETPTGKKLAASLPQITQESMEVGREWGKNIGMRAVARMKEQQGKK